MLKYFRIIFSFLFIVFLVIWQRSFIVALPGWLKYLNTPLVVLIFILVLSGAVSAGWWAAGVGAVMDIYSFTPFGVFTLVFLLTIIGSNFLFQRFLTNRSLYSFLVLILFATFFYEFLLGVSDHLIISLGSNPGIFIFNKGFWSALGRQIMTNAGATFLIFYLFNFISNRFRPVFIRG